MGLKNGITHEEASKIIGNHFPEVKDKNMYVYIRIIFMKINIL